MHKDNVLHVALIVSATDSIQFSNQLPLLQSSLLFHFFGTSVQK